MIRKRGKVWILYDSKGKKILGRHKTKASAQRQEAAVNLSKARAAGHRIPRRGAKRR